MSETQSSSRLPMLAATMLVVAAAASVRFSFGVGFFNSLSVLDVMLLLALIPAGFLLVGGRELSLGDATVFGCLLLPLLISAASTLWSQDLDGTLRTVVFYVESIVAYLCAVNLLKDASVRTIARLLMLFVWVLLLVCALMYLRVPGFEPLIAYNAGLKDTLVSYFSRLSHPFLGASNNLAGVLAFLLFPIAASARLLKSRFGYFTTAIAFLAVALTFSRGVMAAIVVCWLIAMVWGSRAIFSSVMKIASVASVLIAVGYIAMLTSPEAQGILEDRFKLTTILARFDNIRQVVDAVAVEPLLGWGAGSAPYYAPGLVGGAHNTYLENAMYFGVPLAGVVTLCLFLLPVRLYTRFTALGSPPSLTRACSLAIFCQLLIFISQTSFEGATLKIIFYLLTGMSVALLHAARREYPAEAAARGVAHRE